MSTSGKTIVRVAIPSPLRKLFDYLGTDDKAKSTQILRPGIRVKVPFGRREVTGLVVEVCGQSAIAVEKLKPVERILDIQPLLSEDLLELFKWSANYYQHPIGEALMHTLPVLLRNGAPLPDLRQKYWTLTENGINLDRTILASAPRQQALLSLLARDRRIDARSLVKQFSYSIIRKLSDREFIRLEHEEEAKPNSEKILKTKPMKLSREQKLVMNQMVLDRFNVWLLDGVTGSGKTEIYLQCIEQVLSIGKQVLVLIPEISLTPQTEGRFRDRFNVPIAIIHSGITNKHRLESWAMARSSFVKIVLGTRSAIFTPLQEPGLIVVDEEQDLSYKQQDGFRYSARDIAVMRAQRADIPIILGSATPSLESIQNCKNSRYQQLFMSDRAGSAKQPDWRIIDMREEKIESGIAGSTLTTIAETLDRSQQVLIFLNRRGFAPAILCHDCGWVAECKHCDAKMTFHYNYNRVVCHHCENRLKPPSSCPQCQSSQLIATGEGTERSEMMLKEKFPSTQILRVDRDTNLKRGYMQEVVNTVQTGVPCILIGTQMLAKGHDFPNVTLVVIVDADSSLFSPDFRATERMGQLITQVAGRSGRGKIPGQVLVQTHQPTHPMLDLLLKQGYRSFAQRLLSDREVFQLPPHSYLALVRAEANDAASAEKFLIAARQVAENILNIPSRISYLGPLPALMERRAGRYRYVLRIEATRRTVLSELLTQLALALESNHRDHRVRWCIDVDPHEL